MLGSIETAVAFVALAIAYVFAWRIYRRAWNDREASDLEWDVSKDEWRARALARLRRRRRALEKMGKSSVGSRRSARLIADIYSPGWTKRQ